MKAAEIKVGGKYRAKVNGSLTTVRVDNIEETSVKVYKNWATRSTNRATAPYKTVRIYSVTNLSTGRCTTFRSAAKFRTEVKE